jgi:hypothetical protein
MIMERDAENAEKTQILFSRDQLVNTATISRHFSRIKGLAKIKPIFITDNGNVDLMMMSYEAYEELHSRLLKLEAEVVKYRAEEAKRDPDGTVDWQSIRRDR